MISGNHFVVNYDVNGLTSMTVTDHVPGAYDALNGKPSKLFKNGSDAAKLVSEKLLPDAEKYVSQNK